MLKEVKRKAVFFKLDEILDVIRKNYNLKTYIHEYILFGILHKKAFKKSSSQHTVNIIKMSAFYILFLCFISLHYGSWWQVWLLIIRLMDSWMCMCTFGVKDPMSLVGTIPVQAFNNALNHCIHPHSASLLAPFCCHQTWLPWLRVTTIAICSVTLMSWLWRRW